MCDRLARRGPDGSGEWQAGPVALGHRRLKIIDLTDAGAQQASGRPQTAEAAELPQSVTDSLAVVTEDRSVDTMRVVGACHDAGLTLEYDVPADVEAGEPTPVTVTVTDAGSGEPVSELVRTHQVWMHLIVTRADLRTFAHLHPEPTGEDGVIRGEVTFPTPGRYAFHADVRQQGQMADVLDEHAVFEQAVALHAERRGRRPAQRRGQPGQHDVAVVARARPAGAAHGRVDPHAAGGQPRP